MQSMVNAALDRHGRECRLAMTVVHNWAHDKSGYRESRSELRLVFE
jgi:hypothetical protein